MAFKCYKKHGKSNSQKVWLVLNFRYRNKFNEIATKLPLYCKIFNKCPKFYLFIFTRFRNINWRNLKLFFIVS